MPVETMHRYARQDLRASPDKLFVFGDNAARAGFGGQAREARGEPNAVGVRTKKAPTYEEPDFFTDAEYALNVNMIAEDFAPALAALQQGKTVVWPSDGIGTGIAQLPARAPLTLLFITTLIDSLKRVYGVTTTSHPPSERTRP
jgi:hypothetical protein